MSITGLRSTNREVRPASNQLDALCEEGNSVTRGKGGEDDGADSRLDVLCEAGLNGIRISGHVSRATAAGGVDGGLECGCLQVRGAHPGGLGGVGDVAGASPARRLHPGHFRLRVGDVHGCRSGRKWILDWLGFRKWMSHENEGSTRSAEV